MAAFACNRCGRCCGSLGPHITIERQLNDQDYYCRSSIDNAIFPVHVDPEYREEIADEFETAAPPASGTEKKTCPFLRKNRRGDGTICSIYPTRPRVCRDFRCYRILIHNSGGAVCGRVIGKNTLRTEDAALEQLWIRQVAVIPYGDPVAWIQAITAILAEHRYRAESVE